MQHYFPILFEKVPEGTLKWEKLFCFENIQVIAGEELVTRFAVVTTRVLYNHHLFTKPGF
jgi:hypothetical protein